MTFASVAASAVAALALWSPALAHPGDHSGFTAGRLLDHLLQPDHLVFMVLIAAAGALAYRAGRRTQPRAREREHR